jgi:hypothetical protein
MYRSRILFLTLILIFVVACSSQPISRGAIAETPMAATQAVNAPSPTLTDIPLPIRRTYTIVLKYACGRDGGGDSGYTADGGILLCFSSPGHWEQQGIIEYFVLIVTHKSSSPRLDIHRYDLLQGIIPTPTPTATSTSVSTPTFAPTLPASIRTLTPAWPVPPTPITVRVITLEVEGYCERPSSSTTLDRVNLCFAVPPGRDNQGIIEYWTLTVTRDLTPTVKYGLLEWATPTR